MSTCNLIIQLKEKRDYYRKGVTVVALVRAIVVTSSKCCSFIKTEISFSIYVLVLTMNSDGTSKPLLLTLDR